MSTTRSLGARALAEGLGAGLLVAAVIGSGIAAERLSPGQVGLQLLENSTATVFALAALILTFGPVSGAHFNPAVTLAELATGKLQTPAAARSSRMGSPQHNANSSSSAGVRGAYGKRRTAPEGTVACAAATAARRMGTGRRERRRKGGATRAEGPGIKSGGASIAAHRM